MEKPLGLLTLYRTHKNRQHTRTTPHSKSINTATMMNASPLRLHVAACYESSDDSSNTLSRPLLIEGESSPPHSTSSEDTACHAFRPLSCFYGVIAGFLIQAITVTACISMTFEFGYDTSSRGFLRFLLQLRSQIDLCLYTLVWVIFNTSMTQCGMRLLKNRLLEFESRRNIFDIGLNTLAGIILGSYAAFTTMYVLLGLLPVPFLPILGTVCGGWAFCYLMVMWCYDLGEENLEEETVEDAASCC
jgi:hypothetical protein